MATPLGTPIEMTVAISRLRPGSEFHWKGEVLGTFADIGEWRDPNTTCPTEEEIYAEWDAYLLELAAEDAFRQQIWQTAQSAVGVNIADLVAAQRNALIVILFKKVGALNRDGTVRPLAQWARE